VPSSYTDHFSNSVSLCVNMHFVFKQISKVSNVNCIVLCHDTISKALRYGPCVTRASQFYLPPRHEPYLTLLPSRKASPPFGWYSLCLPLKGWSGKINVRPWELSPDTVIHPSTNRARHRLISLIETIMSISLLFVRYPVAQTCAQ